MKKINFISIIAMLLAVAPAILFSCGDEKKETPVESAKMTLETFKEVGDLHNLFMSNVRDNFIAPNDILSFEEGVNLLRDFNINYAKSLPLDKEFKAQLIYELDRAKNLADYKTAHYRLFCLPTRSDGNIEEMNVYQLMNIARDEKLIDDFEYQSLNQLAVATQQVYEGNMFTLEFDAEIDRLIRLWESKGYLVDGDFGATLGNILAVSNASREYWELHPYDPGYDEEELLIPVWLANDIGGALVGAIYSGVSSGIAGDFSWSSVGRGALGGAIAGSTGLAGKIGGWIRGLF